MKDFLWLPFYMIILLMAARYVLILLIPETNPVFSHLQRARDLQQYDKAESIC